MGEGAGGVHPPEMTCGFLIQLVFYIKFVYVTSYLRHSLVVHLLLRKILDPPLRGYRGSQGVGGGYKGLKGVTRGDRWLQGVTGAYRGIQGISAGTVRTT